MNTKFTSIAASAGLLLAATIWGFSFVIVKDSLDYIGAFYMVAYRYTIAAVTMSLIFIKKWKLLSWEYIRHGALTGLFLFLAYATQTVGCDYTTAGKNAFLTTFYVIMIPVLTWLLFKKRPRFYVFIAAVMSLTSLTSAGEFAALSIIATGGSYISMAVSQLIINLRYILMIFALSQRIAPNTSSLHRTCMSYGITDEIFGVSVKQERPLSPFYTYGAVLLASPGMTDMLPWQCLHQCCSVQPVLLSLT